jgi:hypothetical protein
MDAGTLNYPGGVNKQGNLQLNADCYSRDLSIMVPENCKDVRVDEAGILRQGAYAKARGR